MKPRAEGKMEISEASKTAKYQNVHENRSQMIIGAYEPPRTREREREEEKAESFMTCFKISISIERIDIGFGPAVAVSMCLVVVRRRVH